MSEINFGKYNDFFVEDKVDPSGDLEIGIPEHQSEYVVHSWLNKVSALELIIHLNKVFDLGIKIDE